MAKLKLKNWQKNAQRIVVEEFVFHAAPIWQGGIPVCPEDQLECPHYDGKRCQLMGSRPHYRCEPAIEQMAALLDEAERR